MKLLLPMALAWTLAAQPAMNDPAAIERGKQTYLGSCAGCHGATGEGGRGPNLRDGKLIRRSNDQQVFQTVQKGVPGSDMPGSPLPEDQVWAVVAYVRALGAPASSMAVAGDKVHGERVYRAAGCANCHAINGQGGALGPDLTNIGGTRSYGLLRESVEKPGERLAAGFQPATVTTRDGRTVAGMVKNHTNYNLQLVDKSGELHLFQAADLADVRFTMKSPMPEGYAAKLGKEDMTDLLAYLSGLSVRPAIRGARTR